jgi:hypothetical protein
MRRVQAGPMSSNYKEKDHKVSKAIDPAIHVTSYLKKQENDITKNPMGKQEKKQEGKKLDDNKTDDIKTEDDKKIEEKKDDVVN